MAKHKKKRKQAARLRRELGLWAAVALVVGTMIGAGILATPGKVAGGLGSPALALGVWVLAGVYAILGALCCAELSSAIPQAGGFYTFARRGIDPYAGFTAGWMDCVSLIIAIAWLGAVVGSYAGQLVPGLSGSQRAVGVVTILALAAWNWIGVRASGRLQTVLSGAKYVAILAVVGVALAAPRAATGGAAVAPVAGLAAGLALAFQSAIFAYAGWYSAIYIAEEVRDPQRTLPRSLIFGVGSVMVLYLLINVAFLYALPVSQMATSDLVAADVARLTLGDAGARAITAVALLTVVGTLNGLLINAPRIAFAMARNHELPRPVARVNAGGSPVGGIAVVAATAVVILAAVGSPDRLLSICTFLLVVVYSTGFVAVWRLRRTEPALERPYRVVGVPWIPLLLLLVSAALLVGFWVGDPTSSAWATAVVLLSYPIYRLAAARSIVPPRGTPFV